MTENEAIEEIKSWTGILLGLGGNCSTETAEAQELAIKALGEIQQYRAIGTIDYINEAILLTKADETLLSEYKAIGTVEEIEGLNFSSNQLRLVKLVEEYKEKLKEYEAIGTIEECRNAMERRTPKKPNVWGDGYDDNGDLIYDMYDCPNCEKSYELDYQEYKFCPECGQAINLED